MSAMPVTVRRTAAAPCWAVLLVRAVAPATSLARAATCSTPADIWAAVWLVFRRARGHTLARPLDAGRLVAVAGGWAALLTVFLIFDRPEELAGSVRVGVRLGPFFSLAGSLAILVGGLRMSSEPPRET